MINEIDKIKEHYIKQAKEFGASKQSTMKDNNTRDKEVEVIIDHLSNLIPLFKNIKILEIGCGNGYTAEKIVQNLEVKTLICIDFCNELTEIAKKRNLNNVKFKSGDVLDLDFEDSSFDIIFTERCLINLNSWEKQRKGLNEIRRVLRNNGYYLMIEAFTDGLDNLNKAREVIGLDNIPQPFHNLYFNKEKFFKFIKDKFEIDNNLSPSENFLSSYYFGSRVLYASLIDGKKELIYNNKFIEFFKHLPGYGNYSYIQKYLLKKIKKR